MNILTAIRHMLARPRQVVAWSMVFAALTPGARAQSIDHAAMEQLFGEPVTTSVTGKPQRATDAPANIEIITQDDIRRSGATTIPDVLQFTTGVDVRANGLASADVGIRGYNQADNPHLMVLVDGRQVYMVDYGRIVWAAIPVQLDEIRQIEVIKGPNSALYGFNAVGGVINIITYDPRKEPINRITVRGGTQGYYSGSAVATGRVGEDGGLRLSLGGFQAQDFAPGPLSVLDGDTRRSPFTGTFNADGRLQVRPDVEAFASASLADTRLSNVSPPGSFSTEELHSSSFRLGLSADTPAGLVSLSAYRNQEFVHIGAAVTDAFYNLEQTHQYETQTVTVVQASDLVKLGPDHTVRLSMEFRVNRDSSALLNGSISNTIYAAGIMWDWQVAPTVSVTNAVRVDHVLTNYGGTLLPGTAITADQYNGSTLTEPSFNSGVVWRVTQDDTLRLTGARGVQLPTLMDQVLQLAPGELSPVAMLGVPNLLPSVVHSVELDYDRAIPAIGSTLRTALFWQRTDNVISWPFGGTFGITPVGMPAFFAANVGYTTEAGLEIGIKGHSDTGWRWTASYALAATSDHTSLNRDGVTTSVVGYGRSAPRNVAIVGLGYSAGPWEMDMLARWQSSYIDFRSSSGTPSSLERVDVNNYLTVNTRVAYRLFDGVTLALVAQQLNQARIARTAGPPFERRLIASVSAQF